MAFSLHTLATLLPFLSLLAPTLSLPQTQPTVEYWTIKDLALTLTNVSDSHPAIDIITNPYINKSLSFEVDMSGTFKVVQCDRKLYLWACRVGDGMGSDGNVMQKKKGMKDNDDEEEKEIIVVHVTLGQMDGSVERMQGDDKMVDRKKISDKKTNAMHQDDEDKMGLYIEVSRIQGFAEYVFPRPLSSFTPFALG